VLRELAACNEDGYRLAVTLTTPAVRFNCDSHAGRKGRVKPGEPPLGRRRHLRDEEQL
jgi:hypothetical protein